MICDKITNLEHYAPLCNAIPVIIDFLSINDTSSLITGRHELTDGIYVSVQEYAPGENDKFEAHRKYIDLQYIASGDEYMRWVPIEDTLDNSDYNSDGDYQLFSGCKNEASKLHINAGEFALFDTHDAHGPGIHGNSESVKKLVFKIPVYSVNNN